MTTDSSAESNRRLAMLIDADNTSPKHARQMIEELARYGILTVRRAYGDWTTQQLAGWKDQLLANAISPVQQFAYTTGKNSTDSALIIDAMDLLYSHNVDGFVIVSSDSDFTRLATRLKESGMRVYGVGQRKTPQPFVEACDQFTYLENLDQQPSTDQPPATANDGMLQSMLTKALSQTAKDDGWSSLGEIGSYLVKSQPSFDSRTYGFGKLSDLVSSLPYVEVKWSGDAPGKGGLWARPKQGSGRKATQKKAPAKRTQKKAEKKPESQAKRNAEEPVR
ncbi:MAG TPA: NYN domain-containing protein [Marmoricola sp.]|jgi:hypothetical protein|nr:NYN domain-containing protein [Marmoricola sp.]